MLATSLRFSTSENLQNSQAPLTYRCINYPAIWVNLCAITLISGNQNALHDFNIVLTFKMDFHQSVQTATNFLHMARIEGTRLLLQPRAIISCYKLILEPPLVAGTGRGTRTGTGTANATRSGNETGHERGHETHVAIVFCPICYISMYDLCIGRDMWAMVTAVRLARLQRDWENWK